MATLDALLQLQRLMAPGRNPASAASYGINPEMVENQPPSPLTSLPDAVLRSFVQNPSYAEGQAIPGSYTNWMQYRDFQPDAAQALSRDRERERLAIELGYMREPKQYPTREGFPLTAPDRYSRPYNLGLGNLGALY